MHSSALSELKPLPAGKRINIQEPVRDLAQDFDNAIRNDDPRFLASDELTPKFNKAKPPNGIFINGRESNSGAAPEISVRTGLPTRQSIERQGKVLPASLPDGS